MINENKRNIAIIIDTLMGGGAERAVGVLSKYLEGTYNVYIIVKKIQQKMFDYAGTLIMLSPEKDQSYIEALRIYKKNLCIDCAISFMEHCNFLNIQSRVSETVIVSVRATLSKRPDIMSRGVQAYIKKMYDCADGVIAVSEGVKHDLIVNYGISKESCETIYNFVDKDVIREKAEESIDKEIWKFIGQSKVLLHVGRFVKVKNHVKLLVQFAKISKVADVKLLLVGEGKEEIQIRQLIDELNLTDRVKIISYTKNPFIYYKLATAFVLTSKSEGLPNVLLEAMTLGIPVIAVDCMSGPRELIAKETDYLKKIRGCQVCENGILVEDVETDDSGETNHLFQAMQKVLTDEKLRNQLSDNALKYMETYSNEEILNKWISAIENTKNKNTDAKCGMFSELEGYNEVIVYGAGKIGKQVMVRLLEVRKDWNFLCFVVTDKSTCQSPMEDIPIYELPELYERKEKAMVVISVGKSFEEEVLRCVEKHKFQYIWCDL